MIFFREFKQKTSLPADLNQKIVLDFMFKYKPRFVFTLPPNEGV